MNNSKNNEQNGLNTDQKLQLSERANEIYRQQLKYMQDHLASLRTLIQEKENIIQNLMLRFDLGIIPQDKNRQSGNLTSDEIGNTELRRKAEEFAQRTILENFELREMVNELKDENCHMRNEVHELQDRISRQVFLIIKLEKLNNHQMKALEITLPQLESLQRNDDIQVNVNNNGRESSSDPPNMFADDYNPEEYTSESIQKRHRRKAKEMAQAAQDYVISHRRRNSLDGKLLLGERVLYLNVF